MELENKVISREIQTILYESGKTLGTAESCTGGRIAEAIMTRIGCKFDPQQTGMFLWGRIPDSYNDVEELTEKVLHEARVFITPGFIFGSNGKRYVRISLCAKDEKMEEALKRIEAVFK